MININVVSRRSKWFTLNAFAARKVNLAAMQRLARALKRACQFKTYDEALEMVKLMNALSR